MARNSKFAVLKKDNRGCDSILPRGFFPMQRTYPCGEYSFSHADLFRRSASQRNGQTEGLRFRLFQHVAIQPFAGELVFAAAERFCLAVF